MVINFAKMGCMIKLICTSEKEKRTILQFADEVYRMLPPKSDNAMIAKLLRDPANIELAEEGLRINRIYKKPVSTKRKYNK